MQVRPAPSPIAGKVEPEPPTWSVVGELSDDAVDVLAQLLIGAAEVSDPNNSEKENQ